MRNFKELIGAHRMCSFIILGGGRSLHDDLAKCPTDAIRIGVNHHAIKYYPVAFTVCFDVIAPQLIRAISDAPIISPLPVADYHIKKLGFHPINSGILAIWAANQMGASKIYCCGMSFYRDQVDYVDGSPPVKASNKTFGYGNRCKRLAHRLAGDSELISNSWW